jgi:hypothetical protein
MRADDDHRASSPIEALGKIGPGALVHDGSHTVVLTSCVTEPPLAWPEGVRWGYGVTLTPDVDLDCFVHDLGGALTIHWDYRRASIAEAPLASMFSHYTQRLTQLAAGSLAAGAVTGTSRLNGVESKECHT